MEKSFVLIVLSFAALATGALTVNWIGLGRAMSRLSVSAYVEFHQHTNRTFDPYMPIVVIGALVGGIALAVMYGVHSIPGQLAVAGAALLRTRNNNRRTDMCPHQSSNRVLVYSGPTARMGPSARPVVSVSRHSGVIFGSRVSHVYFRRDVEY